MSLLISEFSGQPDLRVHLVLYGRNREVFYELPDDVSLHRPEFEFDRYPRILSTLLTLLFVRRTLLALKADGVLSFGERWNSFVLLALLGVRIPVFVSDRCRPEKSLGWLHDRLRRWLYPRATGVIAQSAHAKRIFERTYRHGNIQVIPNPVTLPPRNVSDVKREKVILSVGRLIESKHHDRLIRLFARLEARDWRLVILGGDALDQSRKAGLEGLIHELKLEHQVDLPGYCRDVSAWYEKSSLFAFTSSSEGFPNSLAEALAWGLPAVSYNCSTGPAELIVEGKSGFLVDVFDDEAFLSRLRLLVDDKQLREDFSQAATESMRQFAPSVIARLYLDVVLTARVLPGPVQAALK